MSDTTTPICGHRWWASRIEVTDSVPVLHVCVEPAGQDHPTLTGLFGPPHREHRCSCGATLCGDGPGPEGPSRAWTAAAAPLGDVLRDARSSRRSPDDA